MVANERSFEALYKAPMICPVIILESAFTDMNRWPKTFDIGSNGTLTYSWKYCQEVTRIFNPTLG